MILSIVPSRLTGAGASVEALVEAKAKAPSFMAMAPELSTAKTTYSGDTVGAAVSTALATAWALVVSVFVAVFDYNFLVSKVLGVVVLVHGLDKFFQFGICHKFPRFLPRN